MCMHCFQLQKEIQEENKPLGFLYKIKNCSLMLKKKTSTPRRLLQTEISNEESNCSSIKFWYRYRNWNCSKGRVNKKTWWNYCHTHNFISEKNLSSSIHVNKKCYKAETCLKFECFFFNCWFGTLKMLFIGIIWIKSSVYFCWRPLSWETLLLLQIQSFVPYHIHRRYLKDPKWTTI